MIYIDPPYNRRKDLIYKDNSKQDLDEYVQNSGQCDNDGNKIVTDPENDGRLHTDWLNMIYPRLKLARDLLSDDGLIFISIDDNEQENLKKICNEIFDEKNFIAELIWDLGTGTTAGVFTRGHEYIVCYAKKKSSLNNFKNYNDNERISDRAIKKISKKNPATTITFPVGFEYEGTNAIFKGELGTSEKEYILDNAMIFSDGKLIEPVTIKAGFAMKKQVEDFIHGDEVFDTKGQKVIRFFFNKKGILSYEKEKSTINPKTVLSKIANTKNGSDELKYLMEGNFFDFPKPTKLILYLAKLLSKNNDIILDFFSGSATTAHAVMQLNAEDGGKRKFIMVQWPEEIDLKSEAYKAGYANICEIGKERIRRAGKKIKEEFRDKAADLDTGFRVFKVDSSNMKEVYYKPDETKQNDLDSYINNIKEDRTDEDLLFQVLLEIKPEALSAKIDKEVIQGKAVYNVEDVLLACFDDNIDEDLMTAIAKKNPDYVVVRDLSIGDDSAFANFEKILKQYDENYTEDTLRVL